MSEVEASLVRSSDEAFKIVDLMAGKDFLDEMFFVDLDDVPPEELEFEPEVGGLDGFPAYTARSLKEPKEVLFFYSTLDNVPFSVEPVTEV